MKFARPPYSFDLTLTVRCEMPSAPKRAVLPAVKAALLGLPISVLKAKLKPDVPYALTIALIGPRSMRQLNAGYRGKDRPTDVLSFSRLEGMPTPVPDIGDILLCWPVAQAQAKGLGVPIREELARLTVHGVLHLFGYDHETNARDARRMFRLQNRILRELTRG